MAIKKSDYKRIADNLYIQKDYSKDNPTKFLIDFTYQRKRYRKVITIDNLLWDKRARINEAKKQLQSYKEQILQGKQPNKNITIDQLWELYISTLDNKKRWTYEQKQNYKRYIKPHLGNMRASEVKPYNISQILQQMNRQGYKPRTQKLVLNALKPMFHFALKNSILQEDPTQYITIKIPPQKKIVIDASTKLKRLYEAIVTVFKDDPYYQALFLFGFTGRRKSEVLSLQWEYIDLVNGYYWLANTKPNQQQRYPLPNKIKELLLSIPIGEKTGYVFKSPKNPKTHLKEFRAQMQKIRDYCNMPELTFHYMRNILVSAMAEKGLDTPYLSGLLGHTDINTINKYLTNNTFKSGEEAYHLIDGIIGQAFS